MLRDTDLALALARFSPFALTACWRGIEAYSSFRSTETYADVFSRDAANPPFASAVGHLFESLGHLDRAAEFTYPCRIKCIWQGLRV